MSYTYEALSPGGHQEMLEEVFSKVREQVGSYKTASGSLVSFDDGADLPMPSFICNISAVQDLHDYDSPWVGGAGKNKLPLTLDNIKALNAAGTWSGNTYTHPTGVIFTFTTNNDGSITSIKADGTSTSNNVTLYLQQNITNSTYPNEMTVSGCPSGGGSSTYKVRCQMQPSPNTTIADDFGEGANFTIPNDGNSYQVIIRIQSGVTVSNLMFYPMIRLSTETDDTFAPYSNICPISGHTGVDAWVRGKNLLPMTVESIKAANTAGTWSGNVYSLYGGTVEILVDSSNKITGFKANGTFSDVPWFKLVPNVIDFPSEIKVNGLSVAGSYETFGLQVTDAAENSLYGVYTTEPRTIPKGSYKLRIRIAANYNCNNVMFYPMIFLSTDTDPTYEPYNPNSQTIQVSWQTEAGEVYGGEVDLVSGEMVLDKYGYTIDGSVGEFSETGNRFIVRDNLADIPRAKDDYDGVNCICDRFIGITTRQGLGGTVGVYAHQKIIAICNFKTSLTDYQSWLSTNNVQVVYELATPITYQLTPTQIKSLLGTNNAWCSTGDVNVKFNKDATTVINSLIARIEALENA